MLTSPSSPHHSVRSRLWLTTVMFGLSLAMTSCTVIAPTSGAASGAGEDVVILAAASLKESLSEIASLYEKQHPGSHVRLSLGPSSGLARQAVDGVPADVFAPAAHKNMETVVEAGAAADPVDFAANELTIAVAPGNPGTVHRVSDLTQPDARVAVCAAEVPCGQLAERWQQESGTTLTPATREADVKAVLTKVRSGEVDAGLVYRTDVLAAAGDGVTELRLDTPPTTTYPIVVLKGAPHPEAGRAFVALVTSAQGKAVLTKYGFR